VIPFIVTDFQALAPIFRSGSARSAPAGRHRGLDRGRRQRDAAQGILMTALRLAELRLAGAAAACVSPDVDAAQIMRFLRHRDFRRADDRPDDRHAARAVRVAGAGRAEFRRGIRGPHARRT
jgi:hypothetical protein